MGPCAHVHWYFRYVELQCQSLFYSPKVFISLPPMRIYMHGSWQLYFVLRVLYFFSRRYGMAPRLPCFSYSVFVLQIIFRFHSRPCSRKHYYVYVCRSASSIIRFRTGEKAVMPRGEWPRGSGVCDWYVRNQWLERWRWASSCLMPTSNIWHFHLDSRRHRRSSSITSLRPQCSRLPSQYILRIVTVITCHISSRNHNVYATCVLFTNTVVGRSHSDMCSRIAVATISLYSFSCINRESIRHFVFRNLSNYRSNAGIIYELLLARSGVGVISSLIVADMDFIIHHLCVS